MVFLVLVILFHFACFGRFGCFSGFVSVVLLVLFRWFRFIVSGFSTLVHAPLDRQTDRQTHLHVHNKHFVSDVITFI